MPFALLCFARKIWEISVSLKQAREECWFIILIRVGCLEFILQDFWKLRFFGLSLRRLDNRMVLRKICSKDNWWWNSYTLAIALAVIKIFKPEKLPQKWKYNLNLAWNVSLLLIVIQVEHIVPKIYRLAHQTQNKTFNQLCKSEWRVLIIVEITSVNNVNDCVRTITKNICYAIWYDKTWT